MTVPSASLRAVRVHTSRRHGSSSSSARVNFDRYRNVQPFVHVTLITRFYHPRSSCTVFTSLCTNVCERHFTGFDGKRCGQQVDSSRRTAVERIEKVRGDIIIAEVRGDRWSERRKIGDGRKLNLAGEFRARGWATRVSRFQGRSWLNSRYIIELLWDWIVFRELVNVSTGRWQTGRWTKS